jgi:hypothetical protein
VFSGGDIPDLVDLVDVNTFYVYAPTSILFVCGGKIDVAATLPPSLREAFSRGWAESGDNNHRVMLAEELNAFFPRGHYTDLLKFESDIAQISELVVLFTESAGSFTELGAFAVTEEIARHLLVIIDDESYGDDSFITLGPVRALRNQFGESAVFVVSRHDINITNIRDVTGLNKVEFLRIVSLAIGERTQHVGEPRTFKKDRPGHIIKLIVGLIQHYGALMLDEIAMFLCVLDIEISLSRIEDLLLCADSAGWILKNRLGFVDYYAAIVDKPALAYRLLPKNAHVDKDRWQADIVAYWRHNEPGRFSSIQAARRRALR